MYLLFLSSGTQYSASMMTELVEGMEAPDFTLTAHDGSSFRLADQRGAWVVLFFYSENDTPICTTHACGMGEVDATLGPQGVRVVGVSPDTVASHQAFRAARDLRYTLLSDPAKGVFGLYQAWGEKNSYGRIIQGLVRSSFLIDPEGVIRKVFRRLNTKKNPAQLIQAWEALRSEA